MENIECPHCGGDYFNFIEKRVAERVRLRWESGKLAADGGIAKTPQLAAVCRNCGGEYDQYELKEMLESMCGEPE